MEQRSVTIVAKSSKTISSVSRNSLDPYYLSILQKSHNIDVSFSSYLKRSEEEGDAELSIFDARKYFSEGTNDQEDSNKPPRLSSVSSATVSSYSRSNFQAGQAASSEASWNSQAGLLSNLKDKNGGSIGNQPEIKKKGSSLGTKWIFRRKSPCPCSSKKAVQVEENTSSPASELKSSSSSPEPSVQVNNINSISLNQTNPSRPVTGIVHQIKALDPIRLTIPPNPVVQERIFERRTRESSCTINGGGFSFPILNPQSSSETVIKSIVNPAISKDEEAASDASSDLFELESFSTQTNSLTRATIVRDSLDELLTETTTEYCYEPSEASVTWSVTTAEPASGFTAPTRPPRPPLPPSFGNRRSSGGNVFLSCRCEKAVMVSDGHRPLPPKSVSVPRLPAVGEKVRLDNEGPKLRIVKQSSIVMYK